MVLLTSQRVSSLHSNQCLFISESLSLAKSSTAVIHAEDPTFASHSVLCSVWPSGFCSLVWLLKTVSIFIYFYILCVYLSSVSLHGARRASGIPWPPPKVWILGTELMLSALTLNMPSCWPLYCFYSFPNSTLSRVPLLCVAVFYSQVNLSTFQNQKDVTSWGGGEGDIK